MLINRRESDKARARLRVGDRVQVGKEEWRGVPMTVDYWYGTVYDLEPDYDGTILVQRETDGMVVSAHPIDMFVVDEVGRLIEQEVM